jgi:hypothetical protein
MTAAAISSTLMGRLYEGAGRAGYSGGAKIAVRCAKKALKKSYGLVEAARSSTISVGVSPAGV